MKKLASACALALLTITVAAQPTWAAKETMAAVPTDAVTVTDYYKQNVYDAKDNKIGDVNDVLVGRDGKITAVILGVGGFVGVGEKNVAVPFDALRMTDKNGKKYLVMDTNKDALQSAPGYSYDRDKTQWVPANNKS